MKSLACVEISGFLGAVNVMVGIYLLKSLVCLGLFAMLTCCGDLSLLHAMVDGFSCGSLWVFLWVFGFLQFARLCVDLVNLVFGLLQEKKGWFFKIGAHIIWESLTQTSIFSSLMSLLKDTDTKVQMEVIMDLFSFHSWNSYKNVERYLWFELATGLWNKWQFLSP